MKVFKDYMNKKKTKGLKMESLTNFSREELQDLVLRMEQELKDCQEKIQGQSQDCQRQKDETEGFKMTIEQLQDTLQNTVKQLHDQMNFNEEKDGLIKGLKKMNQETIANFEKKKDLFEKLKSENVNYLREIDELKIRLQLSQSNTKNQEGSVQKDDLELKIRENVQLKSSVKELNQQIQKLEQNIQALQMQNKANEEENTTLKEKIKTLVSQNKQTETEIKNQKSQIVQLQELNKISNQKQESLKLELQQLKVSAEQKERDIQQWMQSLQESSKQNNELQQKIKQLEHDNELRQTKSNHEAIRTKEYYEKLIKEIKENQVQVQSNDMKDKERCQQLTEELEKIRKSESQKNDEIQELSKSKIAFEEQLTELKVKNISLEQEKITLEKNLDQAQKKRELAKKEVLKLSEKLEKKLNVIEEEEEGQLKAKSEVQLNELGLQKSNSEKNEVTSQFGQQLKTVSGQDLAVMKNFKKQFEQLYKELLRMVMTAPTSMANQSPPKSQQKQDPPTEQVVEEGQKSVRRVQSVDTMKNQVSSQELRNNIVFTIPAQEFSKYERKYNNTLAGISEYLDNPDQNTASKLSQDNTAENKWYSMQNIKRNVNSVKQNIRQNPFKMIQCMQVENEIGTITRPIRNIPGRPPVAIKKQISYTGDKGSISNQLRIREEEKKMQSQLQIMKQEQQRRRPQNAQTVQMRSGSVNKYEQL